MDVQSYAFLFALAKPQGWLAGLPHMAVRIMGCQLQGMPFTSQSVESLSVQATHLCAAAQSVYLGSCRSLLFVYQPLTGTRAV